MECSGAVEVEVIRLSIRGAASERHGIGRRSLPGRNGEDEIRPSGIIVDGCVSRAKPDASCLSVNFEVEQWLVLERTQNTVDRRDIRTYR